MSPVSNCPHCGAVLEPLPASATHCPACRQPLAPQPKRPRRVGYILWALGLILLPVLIASVFRVEGAIVACTFLVAPACGLAAGILLGVNLGRSGGTKLALALGLSVVCVICTELLMTAGCASGLLNLKMDFR